MYNCIKYSPRNSENVKLNIRIRRENSGLTIVVEEKKQF